MSSYQTDLDVQREIAQLKGKLLKLYGTEATRFWESRQRHLANDGAALVAAYRNAVANGIALERYRPQKSVTNAAANSYANGIETVTTGKPSKKAQRKAAYAAHTKMLIEAVDGKIDEMELEPWQFDEVMKFRDRLIAHEWDVTVANIELNEVVEGLPIYTDANKLHGYGESHWGGTSTTPLVSQPAAPVEKAPVSAVVQYAQTGGTDWEPADDPLGPDYEPPMPWFKLPTPDGWLGH